MALQLLPVLLEHQTVDLEKREGEAERDAKDLLRLSFEDRLDRIRRAHARFRGVALARLLLLRAWKHVPAEPRAVYELAETAQAVLRHTVASPTASAFSVRAAIYAGNALRAQGDLQAADARFAFARGLITHSGVTDSLLAPRWTGSKAPFGRTSAASPTLRSCFCERSCCIASPATSRPLCLR